VTATVVTSVVPEDLTISLNDMQSFLPRISHEGAATQAGSHLTAGRGSDSAGLEINTGGQMMNGKNGFHHVVCGVTFRRA
jgi:hypothetical protein